MVELRLSLGYSVVVAPDFGGLGQAVSRALASDASGVAARGRRCVVVTNEMVDSLHGDACRHALAAAGWTPRTIHIPEGESNKNIHTWVELVEAVLALGVDRTTPLLALGGGVVGDIAGFAAATALRGIPLVQVPTTLLAMVDASVGGKTGVNAALGKNLIGAFHQPSLVWAPLGALSTLPLSEIRCGLGEVVKHAIIDGEEALAMLERDAPLLASAEPEALARVVSHSVRTKARIVESDPMERGMRAVLNLGHTVGHAVEAVAGFGNVRHGEAVALGILAEARWAARHLPGADTTLAPRLCSLFGAIGLPLAPPSGLNPAALVAAVGFDKKRAHAMVLVAVPLAVGEVRIHPLPLSACDGLIQALWET